MLGGEFRPWGHLHWVLDKCTVDDWSFLGCISTEDRCLSTWTTLVALSLCRTGDFFRIRDPEPRNPNLVESSLRDRHFTLLNSGGPLSGVWDFALLDPISKIRDRLDQFVGSATPNIILDISSFPKKFFFPIVKYILELDHVENFVITYAIPERYSTGDLAENPEPWACFPGFNPKGVPGSKESYEFALVGVGFLPLGLSELFHSQQADKICLFSPFPSVPTFYNRNWMFIEEITRELSDGSSMNPIRIDALNASEVFDAICMVTGYGTRTALVAPYGPKPMSLAMCLYACAVEACGLPRVPAYYSQPRTYSPEYSTGVHFVDGREEVFAYCVRMQGQDLYSLRRK